MKFVQCNVFSDEPYSGNSLAVFPNAEELTSVQMQLLTRELRHFETAFVTGPLASDGAYPLRVFDLEEELPFAGHPLLGTAAVLHHEEYSAEEICIEFSLAGRSVSLRSARKSSEYEVMMNQGKPEYLNELDDASAAEFAKCFSLTSEDLAEGLPLEVISTGLRYLVVPLSQGLDRASICVDDLSDRLEQVGAKYAYLVDTNALEGRHWTNDGRIEDVATGSAAGAIGAYLHKHGLLGADGKISLSQGQHAGRASRISVQVAASAGSIEAICVGGQVSILAHGSFEVLP